MTERPVISLEDVSFTVERGEMGLGGVLHHPQPAALRQVVEPIEIDRQAGEVHRHDRLGARRDRRFGLVEVDVA